MASLNEKVETVTVQLGLTRGAPFAQAIAQALKMLGLEERASNLNLVEKADLCLAELGCTPSSSATAPSQVVPMVVQGAVAVPSSNAETPMGLPVLPTGPSSYGQEPAYGAPQAMAREGAAGSGLISAHELQGCWVGCALLAPWSGSLRAVNQDTYVRDWQMCLIIPLCGREYRRTPGTNTFHWHEHGQHKGNEDWENFSNSRCACMAPGEPPSGAAVGLRLC